MATCQDGTLDVNMTLWKVVRTCHHICRLIRRSMLLKIKPNTDQTPGTTDKIEEKQYG